jgi:hypothetical protein
MKRWWVLGVASAAALLVGGVAAAQGTGNAPSPPPAAAGGITQHVSLTPKEELSQAESFLVRMDQGRTVVREQLQAARAQRDIVKTLCLNDKLTQLDVAFRSGRERKDQLQAAVQRQDTEGADHEFTILSVLRQRADQLTAEANLCVGQIGDINEPTRVDVKVDPGIPPEPFGWGRPTDQTIIDPPSCASCIK